MEKRIRRLGVFMMLCFAALFIQLNNIQVVKSNALATAPQNPRVQAAERSLGRGDIVSADGVVLASSVPTTSGVYKYQRVYNPSTAINFSQIVGYDTIFGTRTGIEASYNSYLESHTRPAKTLRDLLVNRTETDNVTLTVSTTLQTQVANVINNITTKTNDEAAAVVLNVKTGAVEAMYGTPTYNPIPMASQDPQVIQNYYAQAGGASGSSEFVSRAFQKSFLPGSTFKVVTSSAVYDRMPSLAKVDYPVQSCIPLAQSGGLNLCNYAGVDGKHEACGGTLQVTLPQSCNTAFAQMGQALGAANMNGEAQGFGFNSVPPLDIPGVAASSFPTVAQLTNNIPLLSYSAFGQATSLAGDSATAFQMALVAAGVANQGVIMTPHLMQEIRDTQGNLVATYQPTKWLQATSPLTAAAVTQLMESVVNNPAGTAYSVGFPAAWNVAAKTGTAETGTGNAQGSSNTNDWMVAFAPANNPRVAVAVVVPNQAASATGAEISGPPMKAILGYALAATP